MTEFSLKRSREQFDCIICFDNFYDTAFCSPGTRNCNHSICEDCVRQYFKSALNDIRYTSYDLVQCPSPGCKEYYVSDEVMDMYFSEADAENWWKGAIGSKAYIANKVSCPMEDCSAIFDVDFENTKQCTFTECHECHRGFCITCQTAWHPGKIKVYDDKEALRKTFKKARDNNWIRCPRCGQIIEREDGCAHMTCYCGTYFCYHCGREVNECLDQCEFWNEKKLAGLRDLMFPC